MARYVMQESRSTEIAELAHSVADFYFPDAWIDPQTVIQQAGLTLSFGYYKNAFDGMLEWRRSGFHVYCNLDRVENSTSDRARFTLGHELGHYFIDNHRNALRSGKAPSHPSFCTDSEPKWAVEEEANHFASNLLMPQDRVTKLVSSDRVSVAISDIELLQRAFRVSFQSAAIRLVQTVQYTKCAGIMRKSDSKVWYVVSPAFRTAGYQYLQRDYSLLPRDCATCLCMGSDQIAESPRSFQCTTTASCWFHSVRPGSSRDMLLDEHAVRLGQHGVFTLLTEHKMKTNLC
jgi:hypothetical protein